MKEPTAYNVYTAQFPFLETSGAKLRPVVVISKPQGKYHIIAIVPISSKPKETSVDTSIQHWQQAKLTRPSVTRVHRLTTILQADLVAYLGALSSVDARALQKSLRGFLNL